MKQGNLVGEGLLLQWGSLVLPFLSPRDLAAVACSCRTLRRLAAAVTSRRAADAARGLEPSPVPFFDPSASPHPYSYFLYTPRPIASPPLHSHSQSWGGEGCAQRLHELSSSFAGIDLGCDCVAGAGAGCEPGRCSCWTDAELGVLTECGDNCSCGFMCGNRRTQTGIRTRLRIVRDQSKGWGLHAAEPIQRGNFVCEYAGTAFLLLSISCILLLLAYTLLIGSI